MLATNTDSAAENIFGNSLHKMPQNPFPDLADVLGEAFPGLPAHPPSLYGAVCVQWRKCGKRNCHCAAGGKRHGPYYYRCYRRNGKLRKEYIKPYAVETVRALCQQYRANQQEVRAMVEEGKWEWRRLKTAIRALGL